MWVNNRDEPDTIRERLDRVVATRDWNILFTKAQVQHLSTRSSDHLPILILFDGQGHFHHKARRRFFFFFFLNQCG